jgi:hypothetical protein
MNRLLSLALLLASLSARAEDRRIEAVRADAPLADAASIRSEPTASASDTPVRGPVPYIDRNEGTGLPVHVGAMVGLVSLPRPMDVELYVRILDFGWVGFSYSDFPAFIADPLLSAAGVKNGQTSARLDQFSSMEADLRVFPFAGSFFIGSSFGRQSLKGAITESTAFGPQTATVDVTTIYATPRVGYLKTIGAGFVFGADAGVQLKLSAKQTVNMPPGATADMQSGADKIVELGTSYPLPSVHVRIGWQY